MIGYFDALMRSSGLAIEQRPLAPGSEVPQVTPEGAPRPVSVEQVPAPAPEAAPAPEGISHGTPLAPATATPVAPTTTTVVPAPAP